MKIWNTGISKIFLLFLAFSLTATGAFALDEDETEIAIQDMMADVNAKLQADDAEYFLGAVGYYALLIGCTESKTLCGKIETAKNLPLF